MFKTNTHALRSIALVISASGACAALAGGLPPCFVDINTDMAVDSADLGILLQQYGDTGAGIASDVDDNGVVDQSDLGAFGPYFGALECVNPFESGAMTYAATRVDNSAVQPGDDELLDPNFAGGVTHFTFDIGVEITGGTAWTTTSMQFQLDPAAPFDIYQTGPPFGGDRTNWGLGGIVPSVQYDTAVQAPQDMGTGDVNMIPSGVDSTADEFSIDCWFSLYPVPMMASDGVIARLSIVRTGAGGDPIIVPAGVCPSATRIGTVVLNSTHAYTEGLLHTETFEIIENPLAGDLNGDLVVDTADLGVLIGDFGTFAPYSDPNSDGIVDTADLGILIGEFGQACP